MNQKKISYLSVFHPYRGGIAQFNDLLFEVLKKNYAIQKCNFKNQYPKFLFPGKSQLVEGVEEVPNSIFNNANPLSYPKQLKSIKSFKPDYFLTAYWMPFFAPGLGWIAKHLPEKTKKIALLHNVIPHEKKIYDDTFNDYFLKQFDGFITLSNTVTKQLLHYLPNAKYTQIFHPIYNQFGNPIEKIEAQKKLNLPTDKKIVLFFGFIRKYKGLDLLIQAMKDLKNDAHLVIAGESYEDFNYYQKMLNKLDFNKKDYTRIDGFISDEKVNDIFSATDIVALTYKSATQSGISAIAKSYAKPVLVTPVGELAQSTTHQKTGWVTDDISIHSIKKGIQDLIKNYDTYADQNQLMQEDLTWENFNQQLNQFLEEKL